jgi:membrane protein required for colicin V production
MPSYLDIGLLVIIFISALLAMLRGFTREVLAIASWGAAAVAAIYLYPLLLPYVKPHVSKDILAQGISAAIVFFATLIIASLVTAKISDAILDSKVGPLDRSLGFVFGAVRGFLLCAIAFIFFQWFFSNQEGKMPDFVKTARTKAILQAAGDQLKAMLPDDPESIFAKFKKSKPSGTDEAVPDSDTEQKPNLPAPKPDGGNKT